MYAKMEARKVDRFRTVAVGSARFIGEKIGRLDVSRLPTKKSKSFGG